jgi:hypothetical protein
MKHAKPTQKLAGFLLLSAAINCLRFLKNIKKIMAIAANKIIVNMTNGGEYTVLK